ncbi:MAG: serine hydrolase [Flavisolibacter sp.]
MHRKIAALLFSLIFIHSVYSQSKTSMEQLHHQIDSVLHEQQGSFAVAFKDLQNGDTLIMNGNESFHAASTMKTPVMIEVFNQAKQGRFSLDDSLVLRNEFKSIVDGTTFFLDSTDDSEKELYLHTGKKITIRNLVFQMITVSSNLATNMIMELVGGENVTATAHKMGAVNMHVLRGVEDNKAFERGLNNTTTALDLMLLMEKIARGEAVSKKASKEMVSILLRQQFNEIIPARLPSGVKVAHKTGSITGVEHDAGIVFLPDGRKYVLVLLSKDLKKKEDGITGMAAISEMICHYMMQL